MNKDVQKIKKSVCKVSCCRGGCFKSSHHISPIKKEDLKEKAKRATLKVLKEYKGVFHRLAEYDRGLPK